MKDNSRKKSSSSRKGRGQAKEWELRLYIAGRTARANTALANLERVCEKHLAGRYRIEVVDLLENPRLAAQDQILALPTLVRRLPPPVRKIIGDLSNTDRLLIGLEFKQRETTTATGRPS